MIFGHRYNIPVYRYNIPVYESHTMNMNIYKPAIMHSSPCTDGRFINKSITWTAHFIKPSIVYQSVPQNNKQILSASQSKFTKVHPIRNRSSSVAKVITQDYLSDYTIPKHVLITEIIRIVKNRR